MVIHKLVQIEGELDPLKAKHKTVGWKQMQPTKPFMSKSFYAKMEFEDEPQKEGAPFKPHASLQKMINEAEVAQEEEPDPDC